jgi:hypothetical protein
MLVSFDARNSEIKTGSMAHASEVKKRQAKAKSHRVHGIIFTRKKALECANEQSNEGGSAMGMRGGGGVWGF